MSRPRECPFCATAMEPQTFGTAVVDVCVDGCRGVWFDAGEILRLDHEKKGFGEHLRRALEEAAFSGVGRDPRICPDCREELLETAYPRNDAVLIDLCMKCGGVFLDAGELAAVRSRSLTGEERERGEAIRERIQMRNRNRRARRARQRDREDRYDGNSLAPLFRWLTD